MIDSFRRFANTASRSLGTPFAFSLAVGVVLGWAVSGPLFHFSDSWQLVINTGTTVVTFLMVFLIQATQNRDATALHLKLDELMGFQDEFKKLRDEGQSEAAAAIAARQRRLGSSGRKG